MMGTRALECDEFCPGDGVVATFCLNLVQNRVSRESRGDGDLRVCLMNAAAAIGHERGDETLENREHNRGFQKGEK